MEIIALSGFARSGKDEAAKVLVQDFGFTKVAFADKLREVLYALNPIVALKEHTLVVRIGENTKRLVGLPNPEFPVYLQQVIDHFGWDGYKETEYGTEIRRLLQRLGTEAGRQTLWDTIWIDAALANLPEDAKVVVSDARFINEFDAVRSRGGEIWRIERDGVGPANDHASETEALGYEHFSNRLDNDGSLNGWHIKVAEAYLRSEIARGNIAC